MIRMNRLVAMCSNKYLLVFECVHETPKGLDKPFNFRVI